MSDLFGNHIVGFPTRRLICLYNVIISVFEWSHDESDYFCKLLYMLIFEGLIIKSLIISLVVLLKSTLDKTY